MLIATEAICRLPVPPARVSPKTWLLIYDLRDLLLPCTWSILYCDTISVQEVIRAHQDGRPNGYIVSITGAPIENRPSGPVFRIVSGQVLHVAFVPDEPVTSEDPGHGQDHMDTDDDLEEVRSSSSSTTSADQDSHAGNQNPDAQTQDLPAEQPHLQEQVSESQHSSEPIAIDARFAIIAPGFAVERVAIGIEVPTTISSAIETVQASRNPVFAKKFPELVPVSLQPDARWGLLLATPAWTHSGVTVCVDINTDQQRLFAALAPTVADRAALLEVAGLSAAAEVDVHCDNAGPLADDVTVDIHVGSCICITQTGEGRPWTMTLGAMLETHLPWDPSQPYPDEDNEERYCLACADGLRVFTVWPHRAQNYRADIASRLQCTVSMLQLVPASIRPDNVSFFGLPCRTVVAAIDRSSMPADWRPVVGLLDARAAHKGWIPLITNDGWVNLDPLLEHVAESLPPGWSAVLDDANDEEKWVYIQEGDILTVSTRGPINTDAPSAEDSGPPSGHTAGGGGLATGLGLTGLVLSSQLSAADAYRNVFPDHQESAILQADGGSYNLPMLCYCSSLLLVGGVVSALHLCAGLRSCKLLQEPIGRNQDDQSRINHLRYLVGALGGPWLPRLPFDLQHLLQTDEDIEHDNHVEERETMMQVCCIVLTHDFVPAVYNVELNLPATVEELVDVLQPLRPARMQIHFPHLLPVLPQPRVDVATFVAAPRWDPSRHGVCFDCSSIDHRVYNTFVPTYVDLAELLRIADLPANLTFSVWVGPEQRRLDEAEMLHTFPGMLICFLHEEQEPLPPMTLGQLLQYRSWDPPVEVPEPNFLDAYCLVHTSPGRLFLSDPAFPMRYRQEIATATGANASYMRLYASQPRATDVATNGVPCTAVIAVGDRRRDYAQPAWHIALLDCRLIGRGWDKVYVNSGTFCIDEVIESFDRHAPSGWRTTLLGSHAQTGFLTVRPGQVFVLVFTPDTGAPAGVPDSEPLDIPAEFASPANHQDIDLNLPAGVPPASASDLIPEGQDEARAHVQIHFLILMPEYIQEHVSISTALPISVAEAIQLVDRARDPQHRYRFARLVPVDVQPPLGAACLIAVPDWAFEGVPTLYISFEPPVRIFALVGPDSLSAADILQATGDGDHMQVYIRDTPWALPPGVRMPVRSGDLLLILPPGHPYIPPITLVNMLNSAEGWHDDPILPGPPGDGLWLLTESSSHRFLFQASPHVPLRIAIEWHLDSPPGQIEVLPATPAIRDHSRRGLASRQVYTALPHQLLPGVPFILDQRPVLLELVWVYAPGGRFDVATLFSRHRHRCPDSHSMCLRGGYAPPGQENYERHVHPGQVLVLEFRPKRSGGVLPDEDEPPNPRPDHEEEEPDEPPHDQEEGGNDQVPQVTIGPRSGPAGAGTGGTSRDSGRVAPTACAADSNMIKWVTGSHDHAFPEGHRCLTTVLLLGLVAIIARAISVCTCLYEAHFAGVCAAALPSKSSRPSQAGQRHLPTKYTGGSAVCWLFLYICLGNVAVGVPIPDPLFQNYGKGSAPDFQVRSSENAAPSDAGAGKTALYTNTGLVKEAHIAQFPPP